MDTWKIKPRHRALQHGISCGRAHAHLVHTTRNQARRNQHLDAQIGVVTRVRSVRPCDDEYGVESCKGITTLNNERQKTKPAWGTPLLVLAHVNKRGNDIELGHPNTQANVHMPVTDAKFSNFVI
ncbi:hypothetical protein RJT34_19938 [Clitoria ternatea]|uniref:Uncharacterized protein n=1 Tax=Clitoria ternatea TaxID=43366 RepID=A0AAN9IRZ1_CLITE